MGPKWIHWPPSIKPIPAGTIPPEVQRKRRAEWANSHLLPLLSQRFAANDVAGYGARARKVEEIFNGFDPWEAHDMRDRIQARTPGDEVARLIYDNLSTAERDKLIGILNRITPPRRY